MRHIAWDGSRFCVLALLLVAISPALALAGADVVVDGEMAEFFPGDVIDNLTVINGGVAILYGATVNGDLTVEGEGSYAGSGGCLVVGEAILRDGGALSMWYSTIGQDLLGDGAGHINYLVSHVGGDIVLSGGADFNGYYSGSVGGDFKYTDGSAVWLRDWTVGGDVEVSDNEGRDIYIHICQIGGDLEVLNNSMGPSWWTPYPIDITYNTVGGDLEVKENVCMDYGGPVPPLVSDNVVGGDVEVQ